jgi:hypothetical protein
MVTIGSSTNNAVTDFELPVKSYLTEMGPDGRERNLPAEKFYIPGSLLKMNVDNTNPVAYGMPKQVDVFFDNSPVFKLEPTVELQKTAPVGWFAGKQVLDSGWAWGQQYLDGGTAVAESTVGEGKVVLLGPEVNFRDQPHGTYKLLFNSLVLRGRSVEQAVGAEVNVGVAHTPARAADSSRPRARRVGLGLSQNSRSESLRHDLSSAEAIDHTPVLLGWLAFAESLEDGHQFAFFGHLGAQILALLSFAIERLRHRGGTAHFTERQNLHVKFAAVVLDA